MITYSYKCSVCSDEFEMQQSIKDPVFDGPCRACGQHALFRVIHGGIGFSIDNVTTIGQLAERNSRKMGKTKIQELEANKSPPPFKKNEQREKIEKVLSGGQERVERYIRTGK